MSAPKTIDFAARMAAKKKDDKATAAEPKPGTIAVRRFNDGGIRRVEELLEKVRTENQLFADEFDELLTDPEFSDELKEPYRIDPARIFPTKLDLCRYFTEEVFPDAFIESSATRADSGLWTWLAVAYHAQFVKRGKDAIKIAADARWVYEAGNYRLARRHFVAGTIYLYRNVDHGEERVLDMLFSGPVMELSRFVDVITYVPDCARNPAFLSGAIALYYDAEQRSRVRRAAFEKEKAWSVWQYIRVFQQLSETRDFFDAKDFCKLLAILPRQFDILKAGA